MNTESETPNSIPQNDTPQADGSGQSEGPSVCPKYRRNGNIARLPKAVRDNINLMIQDGLTYREIMERLGEHGKGLDYSNFTRWKDGGYRDWLLEQDWLAERRARQESAGHLLDDCDSNKVNQGALQLGTLYIYDALRDLRSGGLESKLGGDSAAFARLLNALSRASRETLQLQKYRDVCDRARAALQELKDPKRKLNQSETRAIVLKVDDILGLGSDEADEEPVPSSQDVQPPPETPNQHSTAM